MGLNTLDLPPFDHILNTLECVVHCGHPMRRQPVISEFEVAITKKCPMNPGFTLVKKYCFFLFCDPNDFTLLRIECHKPFTLPGFESGKPGILN